MSKKHKNFIDRLTYAYIRKVKNGCSAPIAETEKWSSIKNLPSGFVKNVDINFLLMNLKMTMFFGFAMNVKPI